MSPVSTLVVEHDAVVDHRHRPPASTPRLTITTVLVIAAGKRGTAVRPVRKGLP